MSYCLGLYYLNNPSENLLQFLRIPSAVAININTIGQLSWKRDLAWDALPTCYYIPSSAAEIPPVDCFSSFNRNLTPLLHIPNKLKSCRESRSGCLLVEVIIKLKWIYYFKAETSNAEICAIDSQAKLVNSWRYTYYINVRRMALGHQRICL